MKPRGHNSRKTAAIVLSSFLALGVLVQSGARFALDLFLYPIEGLTNAEGLRRVQLLRLTEQISGAILTAYILLLILAAFALLVWGIYLSRKQLALFFSLQMGIVGLCTLPFACVDSFFRMDYLNVFLTVGPTLLVICGAYGLACRFRRRRAGSSVSSHIS